MPRKRMLQYFIVLLLVQTIAFLPMYTQNFMYGDDLWGFSTEFEGTVKNGLLFSRPFIYFLYGILPKLSFLTLKYFRICNAMFLYLFGCILLKFVLEKTKDIKRAFFMAVCAVVGCMAVDCIAYASIFPINVSLMVSAISFIIYSKAERLSGRKKSIAIFTSGVSLFTAFFFYQIGTPIVFVFYVFYEKF